MAAASGEAEENYWPGYVDALTTMTMVLTFILMVLGIVIFILSQELSKKGLVAVAQAIGMDASKRQQSSSENLTAAIMAKLEQVVPKPPPGLPAPEAQSGGER